MRDRSTHGRCQRTTRPAAGEVRLRDLFSFPCSAATGASREHRTSTAVGALGASGSLVREYRRLELESNDPFVLSEPAVRNSESRSSLPPGERQASPR